MTARVDPEWAVIIRDAIQDALFELHTGLPASVEAFDAAAGTCDVQPLLRRAYVHPDDDDRELLLDLPVISAVPIHYAAGGGWAITFPLERGDIVYLTFAERSLDRWKEAQPLQRVDPVEASLHPLAGAVAVPGLRPRTAALSGLQRGGLRLGKEDGSTEIFIDVNGKVTIKATQVAITDENASKSYVLGEDLVQYLQQLTIWLQTHTHAFTAPSGPVLPPAVPPPSVPLLLSQKIKGE